MNEPKNRKEILRAIQFYGGRIIPADVSANTGLSIEETIRQLNNLALVMKAHLEVSAKGDILYCFSHPDWLATNWQTVEAIGRTLGKIILQLFLLLNLVARQFLQAIIWLSPIPVALLLLFSAYILRGAPTHTESRFLGLIMFVVLFVVACVIQKGFLWDCVSFIVGPRSTKNYDMWHNMAEFIRQHGGVVIGEQLTQITGVQDNQGSNAFSVLVHFDGRPIVSDTGNILYTFPSLILTADNKVREGGHGSPEEEPRYEFTDIPKDRETTMLWYVAINAIAFIALFYFTHFPTALYWLSELSWIKMLQYYSLTFAIVFGVYPLLRALLIYFLNIPIDNRNYLRSTALKNVTLERLDEAYAYQKQLTDIGHEKIIYKTNKDILEQQFDDL